IGRCLECGAEVGSGDNLPGSARNKNGVGSGVVYAHTGGDIGASHSWRAGISYLQTRAQDRNYPLLDLAGNDAQVGFNGKSHVAIADFIWKYAPNGNAQNTNFKLQGEYFWRRESGEFSRVRLQWGQSKTQAGVTDNQLFLQYILTLGAHGAHKF